MVQNENAALASSIGDTLTDLKPGAPLDRRQSGPRNFMAGSNSSCSSNEARTSRFNDRPVAGSPMLAARECFSTSSDRSQISSSMVDYLSISAKGKATNSSSDSSQRSDKSSGIKLFHQKAKNKIETTKEILDRRMNRIGKSFFRENPSQKVPRFVPNELSLGDVLGEGEFGSVYEIESLERQPLPCLDLNSILDSEMHRHTSDDSAISAPGAPVGSTFTHPLVTDLIVGSGNLDNFLQRRAKGFEEQPVIPSITEKENTTKDNPFHNTHNNNDVHNGYSKQQFAKHPITSDTMDSVEIHDLHAPRRRAALKVSDQKGQMINRQNNTEGLDSFDGYVVKVVKDDIHNERKKRVAAADMASEAKLLSALSHPNIIHIRGIMGYIERPGNYGIIMDKLRSTLKDQIHEWAKITLDENISKAAPEKHILLENTPHWVKKDKKKRLFRQTEFFVERMEAVLDVSEALKYLHEKRIIFRDLKPENVGLTSDNYVLFDFGLSRELKENDRVGSALDQYRATGLTGSRLFMAPEVATKKPYGFSADVFSFAIMFWEVVSLKEVFPTITMYKHYKQVILKGKRPPSLKDILPFELNEMLEASWDKNPSNRPTFESISEILTQELEKHENNNISSSNHFSSSFRNFSGFASWYFNDENNEENVGDREVKTAKSYRTLKKQLHLELLENVLEKVTETILKKSPKNSRSSSPMPGLKYNADS